MTTLERRVICQDWLESERGWGTRPDGCSLHLTEDDLRRYVETYWAGMPDEVPEEYSKPTGNPYPLQVTQVMYKRIEKGEYGIRLWQWEMRELQKLARTDAIGRLI